tara:strand:- start:1538 stop:2110 length:573 start_codon:yes stop_codon:yes gene_type:complete
MITREILNSHPVKNLKAEIRKVKQSLGYSKLNKNELVNLMMKNKENFNHIKMYVKPKRKKVEPKKEEPLKVKAKPVPKKPAKKIKVKKTKFIEGLIEGKNQEKQKEVLKKIFKEYGDSDKETQEGIREELDRYKAGGTKDLTKSRQARRDFFEDLIDAEQQLFRLQNPKLYREFLEPTKKQLEKEKKEEE